MATNKSFSDETDGPVGAHAGHKPALVRLRREFIESQLPFGYRLPLMGLDSHVLESTTRLLASPYHHLIVLEDPPGVVTELTGYAMGLRKLVPGITSGRIGVIEELYVQPRHRKTGLGNRLHSALVRALFASGVDRLEVQVLARNEASVKLWQHLGYAPHLYVLEGDVPHLPTSVPKKGK